MVRLSFVASWLCDIVVLILYSQVVLGILDPCWRYLAICVAYPGDLRSRYPETEGAEATKGDW